MNKTQIKENTQIKKIEKGCNNYKHSYYSHHPKFEKLGNWIEKESTIFKNEAEHKKMNKPNFKRGEIIKVDFGINLGSELSNTHFAIVLNSDDNNNVDNITVLPLTSKPGYKRLLLGNVLATYGQKYNRNTYALITQITTISKSKIFKNNNKIKCDNNTIKYINQEIINFLTK